MQVERLMRVVKGYGWGTLRLIEQWV